MALSEANSRALVTAWEYLEALADYHYYTDVGSVTAQLYRQVKSLDSG